MDEDSIGRREGRIEFIYLLFFNFKKNFLPPAAPALPFGGGKSLRFL